MACLVSSSTEMQNGIPHQPISQPSNQAPKPGFHQPVPISASLSPVSSPHPALGVQSSENPPQLPHRPPPAASIELQRPCQPARQSELSDPHWLCSLSPCSARLANWLSAVTSQQPQREAQRQKSKTSDWQRLSSPADAGSRTPTTGPQHAAARNNWPKPIAATEHDPQSCVCASCAHELGGQGSLSQLTPADWCRPHYGAYTTHHTATA